MLFQNDTDTNKKNILSDFICNEKAFHKKEKKYFLKLVKMVGFLEDDSCQQYGLTIEEYLHPTKETTIRIKKMMTNPR